MSARFFASLLPSGCSGWGVIAALIASITSAPAAAQGDRRVLTSRSGLPVVIVEAPESRWAVVQLHVRTAGEGLTADQARGLATFGAALARGGDAKGKPASERVAAAGGETRVLRSLDSVVISDGLPADNLDDALRAMDTRLRERRRLVPPLVPVPMLSADEAPPPVVRQLMAPGHPYALPSDGATTPEVLTGLSDQLLRRDNVVLVVLTPLKAGSALAHVNRWVRAPLSRGATTVPAAAALDGARVALAPQGGETGTSVWLPLPAAEGDDRTRRRAALLVLADLLGAEHGSAVALDWLAFRVQAAEGTAGERARLDELKAAARALDDDAIAASRARARTALARPTREPARLALARGRAVLLGLDDEAVDGALVALPPAAVRALAEQLSKGGRVMLRRQPTMEAER